MGLIAREVEQAGIPTVTLNNFRPHVECILPPRTVYVQYPYGAQWGPPKAPAMQRILVDDVLKALVSIEMPGTIVDLPYIWEEACKYCEIG